MRTCWAMLLLAVSPFVTTAHAEPQVAAKTILDGAFTAEQAARGQAAYMASCARCHGEDLLGNTTPLKTDRFIDRWREESVDLLFAAIKSTMPRGSGGTLSDQVYTDIVTHLLQENGYPAGNGELTLDSMKSVMFVGKDGPRAVPNLSLVQVVGCLSTTPNGIWNLTNGSEPIRVREADQITPDDMARAPARALGVKTFRLNLDTLIKPFEPQPHVGHKMYLKGVLNRQSTGERLNVTAIAMVAESCAP